MTRPGIEPATSRSQSGRSPLSHCAGILFSKYVNIGLLFSRTVWSSGHMRTVMIHISLINILAGCSESSLLARRRLGSSATHSVPCEGLIRLRRCAGRSVYSLMRSCKKCYALAHIICKCIICRGYSTL